MNGGRVTPLDLEKSKCPRRQKNGPLLRKRAKGEKKKKPTDSAWKKKSIVLLKKKYNRDPCGGRGRKYLRTWGRRRAPNPRKKRAKQVADERGLSKKRRPVFGQVKDLREGVIAEKEGIEQEIDCRLSRGGRQQKDWKATSLSGEGGYLCSAAEGRSFQCTGGEEGMEGGPRCFYAEVHVCS